MNRLGRAGATGAIQLLAAVAAGVLAACQASVDLSDRAPRYFACDRAAPADAGQCAADWVCGKEGTCHPTDGGVAWLCDSDRDCDVAWRCALSGRCTPASAETLEPATGAATAVELLSPTLLLDVPDRVARGALSSEFLVDPIASTLASGTPYAWASGPLVTHAVEFEQPGLFDSSGAPVFPSDPLPLVRVNDLVLPAAPQALATAQDLLIAVTGTSVKAWTWAPEGDVDLVPGFAAMPFPPDALVASSEDFYNPASPAVLLGLRRAPAGLASQPIPPSGATVSLPLPESGPLVDVYSLDPAILLLTPANLWATARSSSGGGYVNPDGGLATAAPNWVPVPLAVADAGGVPTADPSIRWSASRLSDSSGEPSLALLGARAAGLPTLLAVTSPTVSTTGGVKPLNPLRIPAFTPCPARSVILDADPSGFITTPDPLDPAADHAFEDLLVYCSADFDGGVGQLRREFVCQLDGTTEAADCGQPELYLEFPIEPRSLPGAVPAREHPVHVDPYGRVSSTTFDVELRESLTLDRVPESLFFVGQEPQLWARRDANLIGLQPAVIRYVPSPVGFVERAELPPYFADPGTSTPASDFGRAVAVRGHPGWVVHRLDEPTASPVVREVFDSDFSSDTLATFPPLADLGGGPFGALEVPLLDGGSFLAVTAFDTLLTGSLRKVLDRGDGGVAPALEVQAVPSPRVSISSFSLAAAAPDAGLVARGYAIAGERVFELSAPRASDWRTQPVTLPSGVPVEVWMDRGRGRVGLDDGRVVSLPGLLPLAPPLPELAPAVSSYALACGAVFAVGRAAVYRLISDGTGAGTWLPETALMAPLPGAQEDRGLAGGRLYSEPPSLYLVTGTGAVVRMDFEACP